MPNQAGFVYILSNPSMPDLVKIGMSTRHPLERVKELSGATGVPTPFHLEQYASFADCSLAERLIHTTLEAEGVRQAGNREFFHLTVEEATKHLQKLTKQLASADDSDLARELFSSAQSSFEGPDSSMAALTKAFTDFEHSARLGSAEGCFMAGINALAISVRKRNPVDASTFKDKGVDYLLKASKEGIVRADFELHKYYAATNDKDRAISHWNMYLTELADEKFPEEELALLIEYLDEMISTENNILSSLKHPALSRAALTIYLGAIRLKVPKVIRNQLIGFCNPFLGLAVTTLLWPIITILSVFILYLLRPDFVVIFTFAAFLSFGVFAAFKKRIAKRQAAKADKLERLSKKRSRRGQ